MDDDLNHQSEVERFKSSFLQLIIPKPLSLS
jgi:hypothetical protein